MIAVPHTSPHLVFFLQSEFSTARRDLVFADQCPGAYRTFIGSSSWVYDYHAHMIQWSCSKCVCARRSLCLEVHWAIVSDGHCTTVSTSAFRCRGK